MKVDLTVEELAATYALADVPKIGLQRMKLAIKSLGSAQAVLNGTLQELAKTEGISKTIAETILESSVNRDHQEKARRIKEKGVRLFHFLNYNYPDRLREIVDAPILLYGAGEFTDEDDQAIAIVGTRSSTKYGHRVARELTAELVNHDFTIVSGLARGIDTQAHRTALESGGRTIAVLGSGLDNIYPRENTKLAREISNRGCVCTEYYLGAQPDATNFPERNRIISGLSLGTVVIEAGNKSGAILTALLALEQNREVFAVPGRIYDKQSIGANRLIKHGAKLVQDVDDILEELVGQIRFRRQETQVEKPPPDLSGDEKVIYDLLSDEPKHIDVLANQLRKNPASILTTLLTLELRSLVKQLPGKQFVKN